MANSQLPPHIRQLVDKNNFVIAIKTLAQEQNISLEQAKNQIDAYEASKSPGHTTGNGFDNLTQGLDKHLQQENIQLPLVPYWVKRVTVILIIMVVLGLLLWHTFG